MRTEACGLNIFYIHTDHLNTPRAITRCSTADIVWHWDSDPSGTDQPNENPSGLGAFSFNLRFPGQYFDGETGLHYNYFRDYDPAIGRYVESDPIGLQGGSFSPYTFVNGNPNGNTDPLGLCKIELRFKPVPVFGKIGAYHAYVVTTDPNGSSNYFRGGPSGVPSVESWIFGNIRTQYGRYAPNTPDWASKPPPSMTLLNNNEPCSCQNTKFANILDAINGAQLPYYLERENSNSVVGTMLRDSGFSVGSLPVSAPAFSTELDYQR